nr:reverse transcriptase domain-containing protein [Tanacetum cinerariifolium]
MPSLVFLLLGRLGWRVPRMAPNVEVNLLELLRLSKSKSVVLNVEFSLVPLELGPSLFRRFRCARTELITSDLICPSTYQLLQNSGGDSGLDLSFDKLASPEQIDIEIRDKKGAENLVADHLSRLENPDLGKLTKAEIRDLFPEKQLMAVFNRNNEPWYADYANYLASRGYSFLKLPDGASNEEVWNNAPVLYRMPSSNKRAGRKYESGNKAYSQKDHWEQQEGVVPQNR